MADRALPLEIGRQTQELQRLGFRVAIAAACTWGAVLLTILFYAAAWQLAPHFLPRAVPGIISMLLVVGAAAVTLLLGTWQAIRGPRRMLALAVAFFGCAPLVWCGAYFADLARRAVDREPIEFGAPLYIAGFWATSLADAQAHWCYRRWTAGLHATLIDDGQTADPEKLVAQMDQHVESMASLLQQSVQNVHIRWVRGSLLGQDGHAILDWALCDDPNHSTELRSLDRHEVAHTVITVLSGPHQQPPMLLCEGWAESQSENRDDQLRQLADWKRTGQAYSLDDLIGPEWYGRSFGPVYTHGGPLVDYLLDHYGGQKFFQLYSQVRQNTFRDDCQRILGDSWSTITAQFWAWLDEQAISLPAKNTPPEMDVEFAPGVDPALWQEIVAGYNQTHQPTALPDRFALHVDTEFSSSSDAKDSAPSTNTETSDVVYDGGHGWLVRRYQPLGRANYVVDNGLLQADRTQTAEGELSENSQYDFYHEAWQTKFARTWETFYDTADAADYLPLGAHRTNRPPTPSTVTLESIVPPAAEQPLWQITCTYHFADGKRTAHDQVQLNAADRWHVVSASSTNSDGYVSSEQSRFTNFFAHRGLEHSLWKHSNDGKHFAVDIRIRPLTSDEIAHTQHEAEAIARLPAPAKPWREILLRPSTLAIAWPALALFLLLADFTLRSFRATR